ncbi:MULTISPECIES: DUF1540 domain-containing protein [Clostridium]|uniref:DUF1540 domain-containing protein n=1 Tax=Clostridium cibarium TaxID=2762247 RepID=A0ABR8PYG4_9CLOT|nr:MULTISPECIES: DUF1540 domain-containing protein [Clostridium]MBD7913210.1 DUF1540 domain-containing protein [Clostridium cibarium]
MDKNSSIKCSVEECKYNNHQEYCTLDQVKIGSNESSVTSVRETDCESFEVE